MLQWAASTMQNRANWWVHIYYILSQQSTETTSDLYRDDGLGVIKATARDGWKISKKICVPFSTNHN
jgi:hypothetical protein